MGSLTANLHLMMVSLYRPDAHRTQDPDRGPGLPLRSLGGQRPLAERVSEGPIALVR